MKLVPVLPLLLILAAALILAGCGKAADDTPLPTQVDAAALATEVALRMPSPQLGAPATIPASPSAPPDTWTPPPALAGPLTSPTAPPSATASPTSPPTPALMHTATPLPSATPMLSAADAGGTAIAQTSTAIAAVAPFTQTAQAVLARTATAAAAASPTPTLAPGPVEPYQIVFYSDRNGNDDLYLLALDGTTHRLTGSAANEREPSCSPDGRAVVFASDLTGTWQIYLLPLDGAQPIPLTNSAGMNFAPVFSPDGSQIAFVSTREGGIPTIWLMNADGSDQRATTTELGRDTTPAWSPDGRQIVYASEQFSSWDLFLTVLEENVEGEFPLMPPEFSAGNELWPSFDSTGERIAYSVWGDVADPQTADIYVLDFEQEAPLPLRVGPGADIAWGWGDDTRLIASVGGPGDVQLALIDVTTGETIRLTAQGPFNGGGRLCTVPRERVGAEPPLAPTPTPTLTPSPTPTPTPSSTPTVSPFSQALQAAEGHKHIVQPGQTLMAIGYRYGVSWALLATLNSLANPDRLSVGQLLTVPVMRYGCRVAGVLPHPDTPCSERMGVRKEIIVDLDEQELRAFEDGHLVRTVLVSTGLPATPTVEGEFSIYIKREAQTMSGPGYYLPDVPWVMYFYRGYGLHGTYWHDNFGQPMSHGCVNLPNADAEWLYRWAEVGTPVLVRR